MLEGFILDDILLATEVKCSFNFSEISAFLNI